MMRSLYCLLLRLHPAAFRREFAEDMLWIFSLPETRNQRGRLLADAFVSLLRQWTLRADYWDDPGSAEAATSGPAPLMFGTVEPLRLRPAVLIQGGLAALLSLGMVSFAVSTGGQRSAGDRGIVLPPGERVPSPVLSRDGWQPDQPSEPLAGSAPPPAPTSKVTPKSAPGAPIQAGGYFTILPVLRTLDANHDQLLSRNEIDSAPARLRLLDRNYDGTLDVGECGFRLGFGSTTPASFMRTHPVHRVLDADGDGVISAEETENAAEALGRLDANGDGDVEVLEMLRTRN